MKKNRALSRVYLGGYIVWLFGGILAALVLNAFGAAPSVIAVIIAFLDLAAIICSHVFYSKLKIAYAPTSFAAFGTLNLLVLIAFFVELGLTVQGRSAPYAWVISIISLVLLIPMDIFLVRCNLEFLKKLKASMKKSVEAPVENK